MYVCMLIRRFLQFFANNSMKTLKHGSLFELLVLAKSMSFYGFLQNQTLFATFYWKYQNMVVCSEGSLFVSKGQIQRTK